PAALRSTAVALWLAAWGAATMASATSVIVMTDGPEWLSETGAAALIVLFAAGLTRRLGGRVVLWTSLAVVFSIAVLVTQDRTLFSSAAVLVAVLGAVFAIMATRPAATAVQATGEFVIALLISSSAGLAVAGFNAPVASDRFNIVVLGFSLVVAIGLVWHLGAGLHGMGRRGFILIIGGAVLITVLLVYSRFLREYGSEALIDRINDTTSWMRDQLGGVPRPVEVLIGFPVLIWGVSTRATRRQGWWMCAFAALGTATVATSLAAPTIEPEYAGWSLLYSAVLGLILGLVVRRIDIMFTGGGGRRARRGGIEEQMRPEPGRTEPLR
ncbi:MAG TPA: hypothetical protein VKB55_15395, partial [Nocardioidaceae bacterium]|nr:hypothetical protein [Nocardioidaceae bacterium]